MGSKTRTKRNWEGNEGRKGGRKNGKRMKDERKGNERGREERTRRNGDRRKEKGTGRCRKTGQTEIVHLNVIYLYVTQMSSMCYGVQTHFDSCAKLCELIICFCYSIWSSLLAKICKLLREIL